MLKTRLHGRQLVNMKPTDCDALIVGNMRNRRCAGDYRTGKCGVHVTGNVPIDVSQRVDGLHPQQAVHLNLQPRFFQSFPHDSCVRLLARLADAGYRCPVVVITALHQQDFLRSPLPSPTVTAAARMSGGQRRTSGHAMMRHVVTIIATLNAWPLGKL